jgi:hypothetical protein
LGEVVVVEVLIGTELLVVVELAELYIILATRFQLHL